MNNCAYPHGFTCTARDQTIGVEYGDWQPANLGLLNRKRRVDTVWLKKGPLAIPPGRIQTTRQGEHEEVITISEYLPGQCVAGLNIDWLVDTALEQSRKRTT